MKMKRFAVGAFLSGLLTLLFGCAALEHPRQLVESNLPFDEAEAQKQVQPGAASVRGSASIRKAGGDVVTCAGGRVDLLPENQYSRWRMSLIYGGTHRGFRSIQQPDLEFRPNPPGYREHARTVSCDAQGFFVFDKVAPGRYFVVTQVIWTVGGGGRYNAQGGYLMHSVKVDGAETVTVALAP